jgi:hypothetical protein
VIIPETWLVIDWLKINDAKIEAIIEDFADSFDCRKDTTFEIEEVLEHLTDEIKYGEDEEKAKQNLETFKKWVSENQLHNTVKIYFWW